MTISKATPLYRKNTVQHGPDSDKDPNPRAGMEYNSDDFKTKNICFVDGEWDNASPLSVDENNNLLYSEKAVFTFSGSAPQNVLNSATPHTTQSDSINIGVTRAGQNNLSILISTSPTTSGINEQNTISAGVNLGGIFTVYKTTDLVPAGTVIYAYRGPASVSLDQILANLSSFAPPNSNSTAVTFEYTTINRVKVI